MCYTVQNDELIESIRSELDKFSKGVNGFSQQARVQPQPEQGDTLQETLIESIKTETPAVDVQETPVKNYNTTSQITPLNEEDSSDDENGFTGFVLVSCSL